MAAISFKRSSLENYNKYNSLLAGNDFTFPSDYELLETVVLASDTEGLIFENISQDYKHLEIRWVAKSNSTGASTTDLLTRLNNSSISGQAYHSLTGNGSSVTSSAVSSTTLISVGEMDQNSTNTNIWSSGVISLLDYASTSKNKTVRAFTGTLSNDEYVQLNSGLFPSTNAVTGLAFLASGSDLFLTGSRFSLYGIKG